jgi:N-acetylmuramoyl-L-alanine amidase
VVQVWLSLQNSKKSADIRNRIEIGNAQENNVFISIHQNKFPIEKYSGLQVYYSANNENSELLAQTIQANNALYIQPKNTRQIKKAGRNILLLHKLRCPAVLVECGFLSNANEEKLLSTSEHQNKLAFLIFSSVIQNLIDENI